MDEFDEAVETVANRVTPVWDEVIEDLEATAAAYREDGWTAVECHPGDVTTVADEEVQREDARTGMDVLLPDDEFDTVADLVDGPGEFDEVDVFRATHDGIVFLVAAFENHAAEAAVLVPAYYDVQGSQEFVQMVEREGELRVHLRPLDLRRILTFAQTEPAPFLPGSD
jgi:hypothetical protein